MKKLFKYSIISLASMLVGISTANATSYQVFANIDFSNPAALNSVKKYEFIAGNLDLYSRFQFNGTAAGLSGKANSNTNDGLPYGRIAMRLSPQLVVGVDITQPYYTNIKYATNSIVNQFATSTIIRDTNYSPRFSYQVNNRFAFGAGFDINDMYNAQLNFVLPPVGNMINKASSTAFGWDAGLFFILTRSTFMNLIYYSKIVQHTAGSSNWGPLISNQLTADVKLPATSILNIVQMLSPVWALSGTVRYSEWNTVHTLVLQNSVIGTINVPENLFNNMSAELATHYQINNKWGLLGAFDYEPNVQPTYTRNVGLPTFTRYTPAIGADYEIAKGLKAKFVYAYVWSRPPISMKIPTGVSSVGRESVNINAFDLSLTYDV